MKTWNVVGINFDHMHMGDLLRMVHEHPRARIAGVCDAHPARMKDAIHSFAIPDDLVFTDADACLAHTQPDLIILCPATSEHALWVERVAHSRAALLVEKPFAAHVADADRMINALLPGQPLMINWPLRWVPSHVTAKRLIDQGTIGRIKEVHYYDGNRGPLYHGADKIEKEPTAEEKASSWWYSGARGGGSLLDYLGYGVTLGAWFNAGAVPVSVTSITGGTPGLEVDEHSITVCRYADGSLSKFETRWGTFSDPWTHQPQPKCGFQIVGTEGTLASYDYEPNVRLQTRACPEGRDVPADVLQSPFRNPVEYLIDCLEQGRAIDGPLSPAIARIGQQIVDLAVVSAREGRTCLLTRGDTSHG